MTRSELLSRISATELEEWEVYEQVEPFGERAEYLRSARLCALMINLKRPPDSGLPSVDLDDFMPSTMRSSKVEHDVEETVAPNPEAIRAIMSALMTKQNAFVARQNSGVGNA